ncbi:Rieske (2Fe-2S) protein [Yinghuangia soli]|jgi:Rieske Fe-S protein|uniref:Cytochrome bc1 complex Rieske iron-sulfur subunit n=1 Tax=Yinghuangia soli TaxID=2908204 RepID=A0AA41Q3S5_9ACTN|nr:Rieske (2Fe-2S) protein [Yinghuangia soli]MCF2530465.1 Rieske (2Fe-2S) protein [Yinghuangia soli]
MSTPAPSSPDRRTVLRGVAAAGVVGAAGLPLAACATEAGSKEIGPKAGDKGPETVGKLPEISVGAGKVFKDSKVVVVQPSKDVYKAYDARCPHQGCLVDEVKQGVVKCPCHGSQFDINDGSVVRGPAVQGLPELPMKVVDGEVVVG